MKTIEEPKIDVATDRMNALVRKNIENLIAFAPPPTCEAFHHAKRDRHEWGEECPCVLRYERAVEAARALLVANRLSVSRPR